MNFFFMKTCRLTICQSRIRDDMIADSTEQLSKLGNVTLLTYLVTTRIITRVAIFLAIGFTAFCMLIHWYVRVMSACTKHLPKVDICENIDYYWPCEACENSITDIKELFGHL